MVPLVVLCSDKNLVAENSNCSHHILIWKGQQIWNNPKYDKIQQWRVLGSPMFPGFPTPKPLCASVVIVGYSLQGLP